MAVLREHGMDMAELDRAIQQYFTQARPLPNHIQSALDMAGVPRDTAPVTHAIARENPLMILRRAIEHEPDVQVQNLRDGGVDLARLTHAIANHRRRGTAIPRDLAANLRRVGVDASNVGDVAQSGRDTPLMNLHRALRRDPHTQVAILMARGHDPSALQHAIGQHFGTGAEFPQSLLDDFRRAGVRIGPTTGGINRRDDPLVRLQGVLIGMSRLQAAASPWPPASPARAGGSPLPPWAMARSPRASASTSASGSTTPGRGWAARNENLGNIPEREDHHSNLQYAMHVHQARPDLSMVRLAQISGADLGDLQRAVAEAAAAPQRWADMAGEVYVRLQVMDSNTAEAKDFVDGETHCMFGGTLSLNNSDQRVVALSAQRLSNGVPENFAFVDLNALVHYVHDSKKHPLTNERLGDTRGAAVASLEEFVLRIAPPQPDQA